MANEPLDLKAIRDRYQLARMAGEDAVDAGNGWDDAKIRALMSSWQDVSALHDEVKRFYTPMRYVTTDGGELDAIKAQLHRVLTAVKEANEAGDIDNGTAAMILFSLVEPDAEPLSIPVEEEERVAVVHMMRLGHPDQAWCNTGVIGEPTSPYWNDVTCGDCSTEQAKYEQRKPVCGDPEHRHVGPCERWASWSEVVERQLSEPPKEEPVSQPTTTLSEEQLEELAKRASDPFFVSIKPLAMAAIAEVRRLRVENEEWRESFEQSYDLTAAPEPQLVTAAKAWAEEFAKPWKGCTVEGESVMMGQEHERNLYDAVMSLSIPPVIEQQEPKWHSIYETCDDVSPKVSLDQWAAASITCSLHDVSVYSQADFLDPVQALDRAAVLFNKAHAGVSEQQEQGEEK